MDDPRVERTRDAVFACVRDLIVREGLLAVTPQRIATEAGVSRSTLHRHWPDLHELVIEAVADPGPLVNTPLLGDLRLDLGVDLHQLRLQLSDHQYLAPIVALIGESIFNRGFAALVRQRVRAHLDRLERVLAGGHADGTLRADIDLDVAAASLAGPLFFQRLVLGEAVTPDFVDAVVDAFIRANAAVPAAVGA